MLSAQHRVNPQATLAVRISHVTLHQGPPFLGLENNLHHQRGTVQTYSLTLEHKALSSDGGSAKTVSRDASHRGHLDLLAERPALPILCPHHAPAPIHSVQPSPGRNEGSRGHGLCSFREAEGREGNAGPGVTLGPLLALPFPCCEALDQS